ncbi:MAG: DUF2911 domain-containing protein [Thermoanaerobaculia bacterium]|nr:DUF2911 domain-containing protein [Thermoanaerobaculia bacterium]
MYQNARFWTVPATLAVALSFLALPTLAQQSRQTLGLDLPDVSQGAVVQQTVGVTHLTVEYHRPGVKEREIFGGLVPYGQVWRSGADENTTFTTTTDVQIEGQDLPAGTYGFHTIPGEQEWEIIFSKDYRAWGSFAYDEANDTLRVKVKPQAAPEHQEWMLFSFTEISESSATLALTWDSIRVPIEIQVDSHTRTLESIRAQLTGVARFGWRGPYQAANYCVQNELECEEAMSWVDSSIQNEERFENLSLKAQLLEAAGDTEQASQLLDKALAQGSANQLFGYGVRLINQGKAERALEIFEKNAKANPDAWFVEFGVARGLSALGRFEEAAAQAKISLEKAPNPGAKGFMEAQVKRLEAGEDIN